MNLKNSFSKHVYKTDIKMYSVATFIYTLLVFVGFPLYLVMLEEERLYTLIESPILLALSLTVPILFGLIYHYLFKTSSINQMHSLPVTRSGQYFSHLLSGITMLTIPFLINLLIAYVIKLIDHELILLSYKDLLFITINFIAINIVFFAMSSFVAVLSSSALVHILLTVALIGAPAATLMVLWVWVIEPVVYGFYDYYSFEEIIKYLSPIFLASDGLGLKHVLNITSVQGFNVKFYLIALMYFLISTGLGSYFYNKRQMENVNNWVSFKWVNIALRLLATIIGAIFLSAFFISFTNDTRYLLIWLLLGGALGYILVTMFLFKRINILSNWKGLVGFSCISLLFYCSILFDFFGYITYLPDSNDIESVTVRSRMIENMDIRHNITMSEPDDIMKIQQIHQLALDNYNQDPISTMSMDRDYRTEIFLSYQMSNDKVVTRRYYFPMQQYLTLSEMIYEIPSIKEPKFTTLFPRTESIDINSAKGGITLKYKQQITELLSNLEEDYANMSYEQRQQNKDLATIDFHSKKLYYESLPDQNFGNQFPDPDNMELEYNGSQFIGSQCTKTLQWLKDEDLYDLLIIEAEDFQSMTFSEHTISLIEETDHIDYDKATTEYSEEHRITDTETIAYYLERCVDMPYTWDPYIRVYFESEDENITYTGLINKKDLLPLQ